MKNTNSFKFYFISLFAAIAIIITSVGLISVSLKEASDNLLDNLLTEGEDITSSPQDNETTGFESDSVTDSVAPSVIPGNYIDGSSGEYSIPLKAGIRKYSDGTYGFSLYSDELKKNTDYYLDLELRQTYYSYAFYFPTYTIKDNILPCIMCYDSTTSPGEAWTGSTESELLEFNNFICYPYNSNYYEIVIFKADCASDEAALNLLPYFVSLIKSYDFRKAG